MTRSALAPHPERTPPAPARAGRPIDLVHLARQCLGEASLELEILRLFDTTMVTYLDRLNRAVTFDELALNLHAMKGAAVGVGAVRIADLAKSLEHELRSGRPLTPEMIGDIGMAVEEARAFIGGMLNNEPAA